MTAEDIRQNLIDAGCDDELIRSYMTAMQKDDLVEIETEISYRGNIYEVSQADLNNNVHPILRAC